MPFCTQCGHANAATNRFCSNCGAPLRGGGGSGDTTSFTPVAGGDLAVEPDTGEAIPGAEHAPIEALPPGSALLVVRRGPNAGSRFLLDSDTTAAGRHPESDIFLDDVTVSRRHAEFHREGSRFRVRDVGSLNGTYVNRERIDEAPLSNGDEVQIGKYRLVFFVTQHDAAQAAP